MQLPPKDHTGPMSDRDLQAAATNLGQVLEHAFAHAQPHAALVVWDPASELSRALAEGYRRVLPDAKFLNFEEVDPEAIHAAFEALVPGDLVALVQSTRFLLNAFRIRLELFKRGIKVIEHPHLARMTGPEASIYIDSLAYDPEYYRGVGHALKERLDRATVGVVDSGGAELTFPVGFDEAKLNVGDYSAMANVGGQYPIGEVFTESKELGAVSGEVRIALFADMTFSINRPAQPITLIVSEGRVVDTRNSTPAFDQVLESIRADEGEVWLREFGLGMNRAFSLDRTVRDVGSFERMCGVHLSLGAKHVVYNKPDIKKKKAHQHVDVFVATEDVTLDGQSIFRDGAWVV